MNRKYTHIFFDLDNTLWDFKRNSRSAMEITFNHFQIENNQVDFDLFFKVYSKHNHSLWKSYRKKEVGKKELIHKRFYNTFKELDVVGIEATEMNSYYLNEMPKQNHLVKGALDLLAYLKQKRYHLFIITNGFREVQHEKLLSSGLQPFFEKVFISEEIKTPKPGKEIFEYAIKSANARKNKSLMVGDDWDVDIIGAFNFSIDAIYLSNEVTNNLHNDGNVNLHGDRIVKILELSAIKNLL